MKRIDALRIHVMAEDQIVLLHGEVGTAGEADELEAAISEVSGVLGVESYLYVDLGRGDTGSSAGRSVEQPPEARQRLLAAATSAGVNPSVAPAVVRAILATFAERIPGDERDQFAAHLPADVRSMFTPPRRHRVLAPARTTTELVSRITATTEALPDGREIDVTRVVIRELRALVSDDVLPADLRSSRWGRQ